MARLPRLALPGQAHYVIQRAQPATGSGFSVFADAVERAAFVDTLRAVAGSHPVQIHAWAVLPDEWQLLATPLEAGALGRLVQDVGRRYVSAYNRRHGRKGSPWAGRYRCGVVEPGALRLAALRLVDGAGIVDASVGDGGSTSAGHRTGGAREPIVSELPEWWQLGNTPFDREAAYRGLLARGVEHGQVELLRRAALGGWVAGSPAFSATVEATLARPSRPRPRGRRRVPIGP